MLLRAPIPPPEAVDSDVDWPFAFKLCEGAILLFSFPVDVSSKGLAEFPIKNSCSVNPVILILHPRITNLPGCFGVPVKRIVNDAFAGIVVEAIVGSKVAPEVLLKKIQTLQRNIHEWVVESSP